MGVAHRVEQAIELRPRHFHTGRVTGRYPNIRKRPIDLSITHNASAQFEAQVYVARRVLAAVEPAALEASLAAVAGVERERAELARHWQLRRERSGYEVDRVARQYRASERVDVEFHWIGGLAEPHTLSRPVKRYDLQADYPQLVARLRAWYAEGLFAAGIVGRLNEEGFRPPKRVERFNRGMVQRLLWHLDLARREPHGSLASLGRDEYRPGSLARRLEISRDTVRRWLRAGWLTARRDAEGHHVIWATLPS